MSAEVDSFINKRVTIYVRLLGEGTDVFRPAQALDLGSGKFQIETISDYDPESEDWEFPPGTQVEAEIRAFATGRFLVAVR